MNITSEELAARMQILKSTAGLLIEAPLRFPRMINFGVVPEESLNEQQRDLFSCLLSLIKGLGSDLVFQHQSDGGEIRQLKVGALSTTTFYQTLELLGNNFDVIVHSKDPRWGIVVSAGDRVIVFGATEDIIADLQATCGSLEQIWDIVEPTLADPAFSEEFWRRQNSAVIIY